MSKIFSPQAEYSQCEKCPTERVKSPKRKVVVDDDLKISHADISESLIIELKREGQGRVIKTLYLKGEKFRGKNFHGRKISRISRLLREKNLNFVGCYFRGWQNSKKFAGCNFRGSKKFPRNISRI